MSKFILVAVSTLAGGVLAKGVLVPFEAPAGTELTKTVVGKLGLDPDGLADLIAKGAVTEVEVRKPSAETARSDLTVELAATYKRADDAEAKVKELTAQLEEATKPAATSAQPGAAA